MTESEAIKEVRFNMSKIGLNNKSAKRVSEAKNMAIQALEKQIPKKVVLRHIRKYDGFDDGECPTCGNSVLRDGFSNDVYCDNCGQKLDWSEESEE